MVEKLFGKILNGGLTGPKLDQSTRSVSPNAARSLINVIAKARTGKVNSTNIVPITVPTVEILGNCLFSALDSSLERRSV